jgi:3-oxoadipate enol-lactonase
MQWTEINGSSLRHEFRPGSGPTFVLLHEMGGTLESWDETIGLLPATTQILRYDQRGSGLSEKIVHGVSIDTQVDDLESLLSTLGITGPLVLAGVAVGAAVAIRYAARSPEKVSHVIAMAPACGVAPEARDATHARAKEIADGGMRPIGAALFDKAFPPELQTDAKKYAQYRSRWLATDSRSLGAIYGMLASMDLTEDLGKLPKRSVLIGGAFDPLRPPAEIDRLGKLAPQAEVVYVPSGHFMQTNSPRLVANLLDRYVNSDASAAKICQEFVSQESNRLGTAQHAA